MYKRQVLYGVQSEGVAAYGVQVYSVHCIGYGVQQCIVRGTGVRGTCVRGYNSVAYGVLQCSVRGTVCSVYRLQHVAYGVQCAVCTEYNSVSYGVHVYRLQHVAYGVQCAVCTVYKCCTGVQCTGYNVQWYDAALMLRVCCGLRRTPARAAGGWLAGGWRLGAGGPTRRLERPTGGPAGGPDRVRSRRPGVGGRGMGGFEKSSSTPLINETFQNPPSPLPDPTN